MSIVDIFAMISNNLNPVMISVAVLALIFRYVAYRNGKVNQFYYKSFVRTVEKHIESDKKGVDIEEVEGWLDQLLDKVMLDMPERNLRFKANNSLNYQSAQSINHSIRQSFDEFAHGKRSIAHALKQQMEVFRSAHQPNYSECAERVLSKDRGWTTVLKIVPIDLIRRGLDILPGLFVVGGIFGTFIGITNALPKIASIDLGKLDAAGAVMSSFVADIAYSMNTSIVGIICSVLMTVLNTFFPLASVHDDVTKNVEQCLETIWVKIHGGKIELGDARIIELLEMIHNQLKQDRPLPQIRKVT